MPMAESDGSASTPAGRGSRLTTSAANRWKPPAAGIAPIRASARTQLALSHAASRSASSAEVAGAT